MSKLHRLQPHDAVPEAGRYILVLRRFAEDAPRVTLVELIVSDGLQPAQLTVPVGEDGKALDFEAAIAAAQAQAEREGFADVYAVDRASGAREKEILAHHGDHTVGMERLVDSDLEEGETGSTMPIRK